VSLAPERVDAESSFIQQESIRRGETLGSLLSRLGS